MDFPDPEEQRSDNELVMGLNVIRQNLRAARSAAKSLNGFGLQLLAITGASSPNQNVFLSPLSAWLALAMTYVGASGASKDELGQVLGIQTTPASSVVGLRAIFKADGANINIANAIWADSNTPFLPTFIKESAQIFGAKADSLDFSSPASLDTINAWVNRETKGKISDLLNQLPLPGAILTNALYFEGRWAAPFSKSSTHDMPFRLLGDSQKSVRMMAGKVFSGFKGVNFEGAKLPYENSTCALFALLPDEGVTPQEVVEKLNINHIDDLQHSFTTEVKLPRFSLDWNDSLDVSLRKMGLDTVFKNADFGPMGMPPGSFIGEVRHKTRLEIDEGGTVAAASTSVRIMKSGRRRGSKSLTFDRPFVLLLRETQSGALLFAGIVNDPQPLP